MIRIKYLLKLIRPGSWIKNLFVLAPLFFSKDFFVFSKLESALWATLAFCFLASAIYINNDLTDRDSDRNHPLKKHRPLASGAISVFEALCLLVCLIGLAGFIAFTFVPTIIPFLLVYIFLNLLYSFGFKHVAGVDILLVCGFYLLRVLVGGAAASVDVSHWLVLCTIFISLFLIVGKRKAECNNEYKRKVLEDYHPLVLEGLLVMSAALSIITYSLYTVLVLDSDLAVYSVFFVLLGIIRYWLVIHKSSKSEYPENALVTDPVIVISAFMWVVTMVLIFYIGK